MLPRNLRRQPDKTLKLFLEPQSQNLLEKYPGRVAVFEVDGQSFVGVDAMECSVGDEQG